jgi:flagellar basal-body rod protein FlgB
MSWINTTQMQVLERFLDLAAFRHSLIATNMANIDTPQYRTEDIDFQADLRRAVSGLDQGAAAPAVLKVPGLMERPDGNNVSLERETMLLAQTQMKFQLGAQLLRLEFHRLLNAINEGK